MIHHPKPAWLTEDLEQLADTATRGVAHAARRGAA